MSERHHLLTSSGLQIPSSSHPSSSSSSSSTSYSTFIPPSIHDTLLTPFEQQQTIPYPHSLGIKTVIERLKTNETHGLTTSEVNRRLKIWGENNISISNISIWNIIKQVCIKSLF